MVRSQKFQRQPEGAQRNEQAPGDQRLRSTYPAYMEKYPVAAASPIRISLLLRVEILVTKS